MAENMSFEAFQAHQEVLNKRQTCFRSGIEMSPDIIKKLRVLSNIELATEERLRTAREVSNLLNQKLLEKTGN